MIFKLKKEALLTVAHIILSEYSVSLVNSNKELASCSDLSLTSLPVRAMSLSTMIVLFADGASCVTKQHRPLVCNEVLDCMSHVNNLAAVKSFAVDCWIVKHRCECL